MSFPWLLVRVKRHVSVSVQFLDDSGAQHTWERLDRATSELLQHEIDHLDGVLATDLVSDQTCASVLS
jgi:peptide deformylase